MGGAKNCDRLYAVEKIKAQRSELTFPRSRNYASVEKAWMGWVNKIEVGTPLG